jgi:hypothetical protein
MGQDEETREMWEELRRRDRRGSGLAGGPPDRSGQADNAPPMSDEALDKLGEDLGFGRRISDETIWIRLGDLNQLIRQAEIRGRNQGLAEYAVDIWRQGKDQVSPWVFFILGGLIGSILVGIAWALHG